MTAYAAFLLDEENMLDSDDGGDHDGDDHSNGLRPLAAAASSSSSSRCHSEKALQLLTTAV
jgi:hypothetical protein